MWPDRRLMDLFKIEHPIVLAPMAGAMDADLVIEVCEAGGLGSLPAAMLDERQDARRDRQDPQPHQAAAQSQFFLSQAAGAQQRARGALARPAQALLPRNSASIRPHRCRRATARRSTRRFAAVEELKPEVVSFHFGLPDATLLKRVKNAGCVVLSSATTAEEARWLEQRGVDAVIAQGNEAGGHRGHVPDRTISATQVGTFALVPQVVDAVKVPVIAAGAITRRARHRRGARVGSGRRADRHRLSCSVRNSKISAPHRAALKSSRSDGTALTNVMTGRPARGIVNRLMREIGPINDDRAGISAGRRCVGAAARQAEAQGSGDFSPMWSGQAASLGRAMPARELTATLVARGAGAVAANGRVAGPAQRVGLS